MFYLAVWNTTWKALSCHLRWFSNMAVDLAFSTFRRGGDKEAFRLPQCFAESAPISEIEREMLFQ